MINKKIVLTAMVSTILAIGVPMSFAGSSNDLLRMDIKKSSAQDAVDVTFYTTGSPANSVVTRKSGNSYVVLLPNVSGNQSVVPSLGGVKDLVSDITVKNVDDGIGGYTKITFSTTKPVKINTATKKTAPLTTAQQNYKTLIAQSGSIKPISNNASQTQQKATAQPAKTTTPVQQKASTQQKATSQTSKASAKTSVQNTAKPVQNTNSAQTAQKNTPAPVKASTQPAKTTKVSDNKTAANSTSPKAQAKTEQAQPKAVNNTTKAKPQAETVKEVNKQPQAIQENIIADNTSQAPITNETKTEKPKADKSVNKNIQSKPSTHKHSIYHNSIILIAGAFCIFGIFLFLGLASIITKGTEDKRNRLKEYMESEPERENQPSEEFQAIIDDKESNWQEKYKRYTKANAAKRKITPKHRISYVADVSSSKGVVVSDEQLKRNKMQETISRMEHSLSQTPTTEHLAEFPAKYHSEDDVISKKMSDIKLKSFANPANLSHTNRDLVSFDELANRQKRLKEGKFVKMSNSPLSMSKRKSASSGLNFRNIVRNGSNFVQNKKESEIMSKQQEDYVLSSINEYMNLLETEKASSAPMIERPAEISKALDSVQSEAKSHVTNPMAAQKKAPFAKNNSQTEINGLNIKSNYNIDSNRSIYMVDLDGITAIIGKINEEIFVLKKFDRVINKPMQVRLDYGNTYIVRVGSFKCLVDVTESKMGTLLEI